MSAEYEELDSFTENLIKRTQERERLLNDDSSDVLSELSSNYSQSSLKSDILINDNKNNIKLNESPKQSKVSSKVDSTSKQVIENLSKISPKRRVPLNQRLNSIARTYNYEDSENIDYIDESEDNEEIRRKNQFSRSPAKTIRQTPIATLESPPKKRLLLNERLNKLAETYTLEEKTTNDFNFPKEKSSVVENNSKKVMSDYRSPTKKSTIYRNVEIEAKSREPEIESKTSLSRSPLKKETKKEENPPKSFDNLSPNKSKIPINVSPVKKQLENNGMNEKLTQFGFEKTEPSVRPKSIYNSSDNKKEVPIMGSTNVWEVRKQFEQNNREEPKVERPEILPLKAKADLFEKAILAENAAKNKQYYRKRNAPEVKPVIKSNDNITNNRVVASNSAPSEETAIKRQKSTQNIIQTKTNVENNILLRRQELEKKLFGSETTTANAYKVELENRKKEIESLKHPLKRNESQKQNVIQKVEVLKKEEEFIESQYNDSNDSIDDEKAHQTVCEAFEEIENYCNPHSEEESIDENLNSGFDSYKSDSINEKKLNLESESPTKNRLYPQLFADPNELCKQSYGAEFDPPEKPPRVYQQSPEKDTTPLRTISFYRRQQQAKLTVDTTPIQVAKTETNPKINNIDLAQRNRKIQEAIDQLKEKVDETHTIAGQASQALNLCLEREEFKGSTERVEAERVLLLSGQKRIVFLNEIQRLKNKMNDQKPEPEESKGLLTLSDFKLQVKGEFLVANAKGNVPEIHHLIGLVHCGPNIIPTNLLNTEKDIKNGYLKFDFGFRNMNELSSDFQIVVHIYDLVTMKEKMTHEAKYHIKRTPKKNKSTMKSPTVRSPGGPNAVMSTSFRLIGVLNINLKNYDKNCFRLENFNFNSPLEGTLHLKSELTVRHPFFMDGFFDIRDTSGFWNMRWAVLNGGRLSFWRFPEDVSKKAALLVIDLKNCINPKISLLPMHLRHTCRPNTIGIIIADNANASKNIFTKGGSLPRSRPVKLFISGHSKEKAIEWSEYLTTVLSNMRLWEMDAVRPYSQEEFEKLLECLP